MAERIADRNELLNRATAMILVLSVDSVALNSVAWKMAETLGLVADGQEIITADPAWLVQQLIESIHAASDAPARYARSLANEMQAYAATLATDRAFEGDRVKLLLAHMTEYERVVLYENNQCDHDDGVAECWHFGGREGRDG